METKLKEKAELLLDFFGFDKSKVEINTEFKPAKGFNITFSTKDEQFIKKLVGKRGNMANLFRRNFKKLGIINGCNINFYVLPLKQNG